ncbi:hypothetical protein OS493_033031 [Desmophyllum pertusum]|uniref:Uncharacterized protein n=1 Tax=Desmophyllum pertusum TaxID=174260 RepID=A0A9W9ZJL6_9CNID|nr:hypothetical protein OS493_033031 [Desmophyllum pertusum]
MKWQNCNNAISNSDADPCATNPCTNGGTCIRKSDGSYSCQCAQDYQGDTCEKVCGSVVNNTLKSPNYPNNYPNYADCVYRVPIPRGMVINISFSDFEVEYNSNDCGNDYLMISNNSNVYDKYCGEKTAHSVFVTGLYVELKFHTDGGTEKRGFHIVFTAVPLEREWSYELIFSGEPSDYILLPRITDLKDFTACWWLKTKPPTRWSPVFSLHNYRNESVVSFAYNGSGSYLFHLKNNQRNFSVNDDVITDERWHHVCITWSSGNGNWTFYTDGVKKAGGVGLGSSYNTEVGYLLVGMFKGVLARFNMWDEYIDDISRIEKIAHACSSLTGNVVPWPEVHLWRKGNVTKMNGTLCKFTESFHWTFENAAPKRTYDGLSGRRGVFSSDNWYPVKGVASITAFDSVDFGSYNSECLSDPNLCHQGLSLSFWLRHRPRFITNIPGFKDEHDNILGTWLDAVLPKEGKWLRCFKALPGWHGNQFHTACDGKGPTVILIRLQQNMFGGFLDKNWGGNDGFIHSSKAFIFSLKNLRGLLPFKMDLKSDKLDKAARQDSEFGPIFGDGDIIINSKPTESAQSSSDLDKSYEFPSQWSSFTSEERDNLLAGTKYFLVDDLEAFYFVVPTHAYGISSPEILPDSQITASTSLYDTNGLRQAKHSILNNKQGSWCAYYSRANEWLELDLGSDNTIYGVVVQGSHDSDSKVTEYTISLRVDGASEDTWLFEVVCNNFTACTL